MIKRMAHKERLKRTKLTILKQRTPREDMNEEFKYMNKKYSVDMKLLPHYTAEGLPQHEMEERKLQRRANFFGFRVAN
jgi:hypothetical protein